MAEVKKSKADGLVVKTNVKKTEITETKAENKVFSPVDIRRVLDDGRELNRQCDQADLEAFRAKGFKPVAEYAETKI